MAGDRHKWRYAYGYEELLHDPVYLDRLVDKNIFDKSWHRNNAKAAQLYPGQEMIQRWYTEAWVWADCHGERDTGRFPNKRPIPMTHEQRQSTIFAWRTRRPLGQQLATSEAMPEVPASIPIRLADEQRQSTVFTSGTQQPLGNQLFTSEDKSEVPSSISASTADVQQQGTVFALGTRQPLRCPLTTPEDKPEVLASTADSAEIEIKKKKRRRQRKKHKKDVGDVPLEHTESIVFCVSPPTAAASNNIVHPVLSYQPSDIESEQESIKNESDNGIALLDSTYQQNYATVLDPKLERVQFVFEQEGRAYVDYVSDPRVKLCGKQTNKGFMVWPEPAKRYPVNQSMRKLLLETAEWLEYWANTAEDYEEGKELADAVHRPVRLDISYYDWFKEGWDMLNFGKRPLARAELFYPVYFEDIIDNDGSELDF